ncbi:hypothetical protein LTR86_010784 [Recurvomyces mirabilis]|nr:hypothetical protein LTR86_010784 [Recurvomyces mirabilis]
MSTASAPVSPAAGFVASLRRRDPPRDFVAVWIYYSRREHTATPEHVERIQIMTIRIGTMQRPLSLAQAEELAMELGELCPEHANPRDFIAIHDATRHLSEFQFFLVGGCVDFPSDSDEDSAEDGEDGDSDPNQHDYDFEEVDDGVYNESDDEWEDEAYNEATYRNLVASAAEDMRRFLNVYESEDLRIQREEAEEDEARIDEIEGWTTMHLTPAGQEAFEEHLGHPTAYRGLVRIRRGSREAQGSTGLARHLRYVHLDSDSE